MADPVIKKRPVVLRLAELQKYPTLNDRYAATLPFKYRSFNCYESAAPWCRRFKDCSGSTPPLWFSNLRAKCIKRTGERWTVGAPSESYSFASCQQARIRRSKKVRLTGSMNIVVLLSTRIGRYLRQTPRHSDLSPLGDPSDYHKNAIRWSSLLLRYQIC